MADLVFDRVSEGVLVHPFGDGAVAADLVTGRAHLVSSAAAWLLTADVDSVDELVADLPADQQHDAIGRILDALDTLRTPGLVGRREPFEQRPRPTGSAHEPAGSHVGAAHRVLAEHIAFRSDDADLVKRIDTFLGSGTQTDPTLFFDVVPHADGTLDLFTEDEWHFLADEQFFSQLPAALNDYAARSHDVLALHAGAVRTPDGRNLVFVGHMNVGKSTLVAACLAGGCDYYSDETIGIGTDRSLVGYPKPLTIDASTHEVLGLSIERRPHISPSSFRAEVERLPGARTIDEIFLVQYDPGVSELQRDRLDSTAALEALCAHTLNLARMGLEGLGIVCDIAEHVPVSRLHHPGIDAAVPALLDP